MKVESDNNFFNNTQDAHDNCSNFWNSTSERGNYWDNYTGVDEDEDGIGDTPYNISGGDNKDYYPLMKPWVYEPPPLIRLSLIMKKGLFFGGVIAHIKNTGEVNLTNVNFSLYVEYGLFWKTIEKINSSFENLIPREYTSLEVKGLRSIGFVYVKVVANATEIDEIVEERSGFIFFRFIFL